MTFPYPWSGVRFKADGGFNTTGYKYLNMAVQNSGTVNSLFIYALNSSGQKMAPARNLADYSQTYSFAPGYWRWARVPLWHIGAENATIDSIVIESGTGNYSVTYFDEVSFSASITLYEGVNPNYGSSDFNIEGGPGVSIWSWSNQCWHHDFGGGDYALASGTFSPWGGVQMQLRSSGIPTSDIGALTVVFQKTDAAQDIWVCLTRDGGSNAGLPLKITDDYLPEVLRPIIPYKWYRVTIPITDLLIQSTIQETLLGGVYFQSSTANWFFVDDVQFVQKLGYPIKEYPKEISGYTFGEQWTEQHNCPGYDKYHTGIDYRIKTPDTGYTPRKIYASSRGIVEEIGNQGADAGQYIILRHEDSLTTSYLHTDRLLQINVGTEVARGAQIGTSANISSQHLHFGLRYKKPDANTQNGALPLSRENACQYPAFPASFLDPENMDWVALP